MDHRVANRIGAACGLAGVIGNIAGIAVLGDIPSAYRPGSLTAWVHETIAAPGAASTSAMAFTLGLLAVAGWAWAVAARLESPLARFGSLAIGAGAILDAAGTPAPLVLATYLGPACRAGGECIAVGVSLLGMSLVLDALFNLLLGLGLVAFGAVMWRRASAPRWVATLVLVAGVIAIPVSLQWFSPAAADLLMFAGPLWLASIAITSVCLWRDRL